MNQHNAGYVQLEGCQATQNHEGSGHTLPILQRGEAGNGLMSQHDFTSSSAATGQTEGKVVKQKAKKTSRLRLIQSLNRANGVAKAAQAAAQVPVETLEDHIQIPAEPSEGHTQIPVESSEGRTQVPVDTSEGNAQIQVETSEDHRQVQVETSEDNTMSASQRDLPSECGATLAEATATTAPRPMAQGASSQPNSGPQTFDPSAPPIGWDLGLRIDGKNFYLVNRIASLPSKSPEERRRSRIEKFDSAAFDAAIYKQCAATKLPPSVHMAHRTRRSSPASSEDQRLYLHIDPAIHYAHSRSDDWFKAKVQEIESRGGRKAWFGKAAERIRWLHAQTNRGKRLANEHGLPQRRADPQPWKYNRPLDFGAVPESQLPEDVLENPTWLRYCAHFREVERIRVLRRREAQKSEQETLEYYKTTMAKIWNSTGH